VIAAVATTALEARAIEMHEGWRKAQALGSRGGDEAIEFGDIIGVERIEGPSEGIIVEMAGGNGRRDESRGGFIAEKMRHEVELLIDEAQAIADHRLNRVTCGDGECHR
jgi:hypothetical protein